MTLAMRGMGDARREWAAAMAGEFEAAVEHGRPLTFAAGCVLAACREMPRHAEGRLFVASYTLALGLIIPIAAFQVACAFGLPLLSNGPVVDYSILAAGGGRAPYLNSAQIGAVPALFLLWSVLGAGHLGLAWTLLERAWQRAFSIGAMVAAATITLFLFMAVLLLDAHFLLMQTAVVALEFAAIGAIARWHFHLAEPTTDLVS